MNNAPQSRWNNVRWSPVIVWCAFAVLGLLGALLLVPPEAKTMAEINSFDALHLFEVHVFFMALFVYSCGVLLGVLLLPRLLKRPFFKLFGYLHVSTIAAFTIWYVALRYPSIDFVLTGTN